MKEPDDRSRRCFLKASSMSGMAVAFGRTTIGEAFADLQSNAAQNENAVTQTSAAQSADNTAVRPFQVNVPEAELTELRRRINSTRWPDRETVTDESQGVPLATIQELAHNWATRYDWRKCEAKLNVLPQFITTIGSADGQSSKTNLGRGKLGYSKKSRQILREVFAPRTERYWAQCASRSPAGVRAGDYRCGWIFSWLVCVGLA